MVFFLWGGGGGGICKCCKCSRKYLNVRWMMYGKFILRYFNCRLDHKLHHFRSIIHILQSLHHRRYLRDQSPSTGAVLECCRGNKAHLPLALKLRWGMTS